MKKLMVFLLLLFLSLIFMNVCFANDVNHNATNTLQTSDNETSQTIDITDVENYNSSNSQIADSNLNSSTNNVASVNKKSSIKKSSTIKAKDLTKYYQGKKLFKAKFYTKYGKSLSKTLVKLKIKKTTYKFKTNSRGIINIKINFKPGVYKVALYNPVTGYKLIKKIKILSTIKSNNLEKLVGDKRKFKVKFLKNNGRPLAYKNIKFKFKGKIYKNKTNKRGIATFSLNNVDSGVYHIKSYNADHLTKVNKIKVLSKLKLKFYHYDYYFVKNKKNLFKLKVKNQFGKSVGAGKSIKFRIKGKVYSNTTNSKGIVHLKLPSIKVGKYLVRYKFDGDEIYKSSKSCCKIYIIPSKNVNFKIKSSKIFGSGFKSPFKVVLKSGNIPLKKIKVYFKLKGKIYKKYSNRLGVASIPIKLKAGKYHISYGIKKQYGLKSKSKSSVISVKNRQSTVLTWKSEAEGYKGSQTYKILLTSSNNKVLVNKKVKLSINSKVYSVKTTKQGYAIFKVIVPSGKYKISFKFNGDIKYKSCSNSVTVHLKQKISQGNGYWIKCDQFSQVTYQELEKLASNGTTDLFLNHETIYTFGQEKVESWISDANSLGMRVHLWVPVFKSDGVWYYPVVKGKPNTDYINRILFDIEICCHIKGVAGINLDYLRYPGNAYKYSESVSAINKFVKQASELIRSINKELIVSSTIFCNYQTLKYKYAQDFSVFSQYMDIVMPMVYKGNNNKDSNWIKTTANWFVKNSKCADIWIGLQTYKSDNDITPLSLTEMIQDAKSALKGGALGLVLFRWGLVNYINFNQL